MKKLSFINAALAAAGGKMPKFKTPSRLYRGRKRFGPGTAKNYNERASRNSFNHYSPRCDENGWNAVGHEPK